MDTAGMTPVTDYVLTTTRAVRRRLDVNRPVDIRLVHDSLEVALQAPTAGNSQSWRWVVVTDPALRRGIADIYRTAGAALLAREAKEAADPHIARVYRSALYLAETLHRVPVHIIPCIMGRVDGASNARSAPFYGSILPAVWSLQLALRARGLGSAWTTMHLLRENEVATLLGIPDEVTQVALLPVAHVTGNDFHPAARQPLSEVAFGDHWGNVPRPACGRGAGALHG